MGSLEGFKMVRSTCVQSHPMLTVMRPGTVLFSKGTLQALGYPPYVQCFYNDDGGEFAIRPCKRSDEQAAIFYTNLPSEKNRVRWADAAVARCLRGYAGARIEENENFRVTGEFDEEENAVFFNLGNAVRTKE